MRERERERERGGRERGGGRLTLVPSALPAPLQLFQTRNPQNPRATQGLLLEGSSIVSQYCACFREYHIYIIALIGKEDAIVSDRHLLPQQEH